MDSNTITVGDLNSQLSSVIQKGNSLSKIRFEYHLEQMYLTVEYSVISYPTEIQYIFFQAHAGIFSMIDNILDNERILHKLKNIWIIPNSFSKHNGMKLEIFKVKKSGIVANT